MRNKLLKLILLILVVTLAVSFGLVSCNGNPDNGDNNGGTNNPGGNGGDNPSGGENLYPEDNEPIDGLVLIKKNVAQFKVVTTDKAGSAGMRAANELVARLRELGIEVADPIRDRDTASVSDCEIIIGPAVQNRPDNCVVKVIEFGPEGSCLRVVGSRVIIAGGTTNITGKLVEEFTETYLGITDETTSRRNVGIPTDINRMVFTDYDVDSITVGGTDMREYILTCDFINPIIYPRMIEGLQEAVSLCSGITLDIYDTNKPQSIPAKKSINISLVADAGNDGFRVVLGDDGNMVIECSVESLFRDTYAEWQDSIFENPGKTIEIPANYTYSKHIRTLTYCTYGGAAGDGTTNDFKAILLTHEAANLTGQTVVADPGKTFYISYTWDKDISASLAQSIPIKTNCEFEGAKFIIDDTISGIHSNDRRSTPIFFVSSDNRTVYYDRDETTTHRDIAELENLYNDGKAISLKANAASIPWLEGALPDGSKYFVTLKNNHKDYIRYGGNADDGYDRFDILIVDGTDGSIDPTTPVVFPFKDIQYVSYRCIDDKPITIDGGVFETKANKTSDSTPAYESYQRNFRITRSNVTIQNLDHKVTGEPTSGGSFPYYGFISFYYAHNCTLKDSKLSPHKTWSDGNTSNGTYDLIIEYSNAITCEGITQYADIKNSYYWGIMASNGSKNMVFDRCVINRIDAHRGLWNLDIKNSTIGLYINIVGGGQLNIINTKRRTMSSYNGGFITLRHDYGSTFNGNIYIKDCYFDAFQESEWSGYSTKSLSSRHSSAYIIHAMYKSHNFGYTCYMPQNIEIDGFRVGSSGTTLYLYNSVGSASKVTTKTVKYKNITYGTESSSSGSKTLNKSSGTSYIGSFSKY